MNNLSGLGVAMVTPFTDTGKVDFPALQRLVEHLISGTCDFLVVLGTTAETPTLTLEEQRGVLDFVIEINAKRKAIIVDTKTIMTATNWIFRIAPFIYKTIAEIYDLFNCFE